MKDTDEKFSIIPDHNLKIIRYKHPGLIYSQDIAKAWGVFLSMKEFTELKYNLLSDYRGGHFKMIPSDVPLIINFLCTIQDILKDKKQALIVDEPYSVAGSMLFENKINKEIDFIVKVFSTEAAALKWLSY